MATMAMGMVQKHKYFLVAVMLSLPSLVFANEFVFDPTVKLKETYSDNVNSSSQNKESSFVTQASLNLNTTYATHKATYNLNAEATYAAYTHDSDLNSGYISLEGNYAIQLWPNGLSLIGSASIQNSANDTSSNIYADIITADTVQISKYTSGLAYNSSNSQYNLSSNLIYNTTETEDNIAEFSGFSAMLNSTNGNGVNHVFWELTNNYRERENRNRTSRSYQSETKIGLITPYKINPFIRYYDEDNSGNLGSGRNIESNSYGAGIRWLLTPKLLVDLSYNIPLDKDQSENQQNDNYYDVDINWEPSIRTSLNASFSQRFYGDSYGLNFTHKNKRLTNTISYDESIQSFTRNNFMLVNDGAFLCPPDLVAFSFEQCFIDNTGEVDTDNFIVIPRLQLVEDDIFSLNKRLNWTSSLALGRTTLELSVQRNKRLNLSTNVEGLRQNIDFSISRKISDYSTLKFLTEYTETNNFINSPQEQYSKYRYYKLTLNRKLNKTLSFDINLSHLNRVSNPAIYVYKENRIGLEIKKVL